MVPVPAVRAILTRALLEQYYGKDYIESKPTEWINKQCETLRVVVTPDDYHAQPSSILEFVRNLNLSDEAVDEVMK